jgi:hypothetical protein
MLDLFLEAAYTKSKEAEARTELDSALAGLPVDYLHKLASGQEKLSYCSMDAESWLSKFKDTPLFPQALALEEQDLQLRMKEQAQDTKERSENIARGSARDALSIKRKMLELEFSKAQAAPAAQGSAMQLVAGPVEEKMASSGAIKDEKTSKEAMAKEAFGAALKSMAVGLGKDVAKGATRTVSAYQRGGLTPALRTAGRSATTLVGNHPVAAAGAAGLGAGMLAGRASK